jgi:type IV pilus assembly protein PilP
MKWTAVIALALVLAACGGEQHQDLKEELKKLTADLRGRVSPLPVVKPYQAVPYTAADLPDPFGPAKIELLTKRAGAGGGKRPDMNRPREPLEAFPLESLKMVGVLERNKQFQALVRADSSIYRVKPGNYMGQNFGLVTGISENQIQVRELIQDAAGDWAERVSALQLQEAEGKK